MFANPNGPVSTEHLSQILSDKAENLNLLATFVAKTPKVARLYPYICVGCDMAKHGQRRKQLLGIVLYPLLAEAFRHKFGYHLTAWAFHPQATEDDADTGPGGVIGIQDARKKRGPKPDESASTALKMQLWLNSETDFPYLEEDEAEDKLWELAQQRCPNGISYIKGMTTVPEEPQVFPEYLSDDLHTILGVAAIRKLVKRHLGKGLVLVDANRLIGAEHLSWSHYSRWSN